MGIIIESIASLYHESTLKQLSHAVDDVQCCCRSITRCSAKKLTCLSLDFDANEETPVKISIITS